MLKKQNRLTSKFEYNITRKYGKKVNADTFYINLLRARNYDGPVKIGIVISTKVDKRATKRNRVKRIFREAIRKNLDKLPNGFWLIISPKSSTITKTYEEISSDVNKVLQNLSFS